MNHTALNQAMNAVYASHDLLQIFQRLDINKGMNPDISARLFCHFRYEHMVKDRIIYRAGEASDQCVHLILNGSVSVTSPSGNTFQHLQRGDVFGLWSFLDQERAHAVTACIEKDADILMLDRSFLDAVYLQNPNQGNQLLRFMFNLLSQQTMKMEYEYAAMHQFALGRH